MIVADSNVIVYLTIQSEKTPLALKAFEKDNQWVAPLLWRSEFLSVLALHLRKGLITLEQAQHTLGKTLPMIQAEFHTEPEKVLALISSSKCSAYDCEFVSLANELSVPLLTEDKQILDQFPNIAISLADFLQKQK